MSSVTNFVYRQVPSAASYALALEAEEAFAATNDGDSEVEKENVQP